MENQYGTILTAQGKALMAACILNGSRLDLTQAAVGDGGGSCYQPDPGQTALKRETWRGAIAAAQINPAQPNMIDVKVVIGSEVGGFIIREAALYTSDGVMLALCNLPDTEKVALSSGVSGKFTLLLHFLVEDASVLRFVVSPSLDTVSREEMDAALAAHDASDTAHPHLQASAAALAARMDQLDATLQNLGGGFVQMTENIPVEQRKKDTMYSLIEVDFG